MDFSHLDFPRRNFAAPPPSYFAQHSPPPSSSSLYQLSAWTSSDLLHAPLTPPPPLDDAFQMQHLRFPTPPSTPPRVIAALLQLNRGGDNNHHQHQNKHLQSLLKPTLPQKRTQSVIMKAGQGYHSPQHLLTADVDDDDATTADRELLSSRHEAASSSGESSSSPSSDYICDWIDCGSVHATLQSLAAHVTQIHAVASTADGLYYCRWLGCQRTERGFNARYKMLVHTRTHTKEKPHQCHQCEKSFSRAENLKIHIRSHSGEKPYVCTYEGCLKAYSNSSDRFKHTRTHSMEKPYMCKVQGCLKRYTDPSSLRKHVKTFKHALQLIDVSAGASALPNAAVSSNSNASALKPSSSLSLSSSASTSPLDYHPSQHHPHPHYRCMPIHVEEEPSAVYLAHAQAAHYYVGMVAEDACHIKADQLEYYYDSGSPRPAGYWITDTASRRSHNEPSAYQYHEGMSLDFDPSLQSTDTEMELETPLDLRVNHRR